MSNQDTISINVVSPNGQVEIQVTDASKYIEFKYKVAAAFGIESSGLQIFLDEKYEKQLVGGDNDVIMEVRDNIKNSTVFISNKDAKPQATDIEARGSQIHEDQVIMTKQAILDRMKNSGDVIRKNIIEMNEHQKEMREMISGNEKREFYFKVDDPVYNEFRKNIKDKAEYNKKLKSI